MKRTRMRLDERAQWTVVARDDSCGPHRKPQPRGGGAAIAGSGAARAHPPGWREIRADVGAAAAGPAYRRGVLGGS